VNKKRYIDYIVDKENKRMINDFNSAYLNCEEIWPTQFVVDTPKHIYTKKILLEEQNKEKTLDIGCGFGAFVDYLQNKGLDVYGCEISSEAIKRSPTLIKSKLKLEQGDLTQRLPYEDMFFKSIICFGVFQYILKDFDKAMIEIMRVTKNSGNIFLSVSMSTDSIGSEYIDGYQEFITKCKSYLKLNTVFENYTDLSSINNKPATDLFIWGKKL
jgi:SAM-dependent methyltransferase